VTVDVNGQSFSASYGQNDSSSTIASKLAADLNRSSSFVTATASGSTVNFTSRQAGAAVDYSTSASSEQGSNASLFSGPSFTASANGSSMSGGAISAGNGTKLYSYSIPAGGYDKNSNLLKVSDSVLGGWSYNYDNLNRLSSATVTSGSYAGANIGGATMSWSYDNFGNRSAQSAANTAALTSSWAHYSTGNNRMTATNSATGGLSYDLSGDVLFDGTHDYLYDAEGRICASAPASAPGIPQLPGTGYIYGPDGERVAKGTITSWSCSRTTNGFSTTENYILGPSNEQLSVTDGSGNWKHSNVYAAGKLLATYDANGAHYNLNDWLGTKRVQVSASGTVDETCWSQPFGDNLNCLGPVADDDNLHFTSKQRDTETGNDYFDARYYASSVGRFMSPDWSAKEEPVPYAKLDDPQSLNLYAYVRNNPLSRTDPDGHCDDDDDACLAVGDSLSGTPFNNLSLGGLIRGTVNAALSLFDIAGDCGAKCTDHSNDPKTPQESRE
jgi:RHS repeat-associated protein